MRVKIRNNGLVIAALFFGAIIVFSCRSKNSIASLQYSAYGCFGSEVSSLEIFSNEGKLTAVLATEGKQPRKKTITNYQLDSFTSFFKELQTLRENTFCTTQITFIARYNLEFIRKTNADCSWYGFYRLKKSWFGE